MKPNYKLFYTIISAVILFVFSSCKKYLEVKAPNDKLETSSVFSDSTVASSAIVGIYADISAFQSGAIGAVVRHGGLAADELKNSSALLFQFQNNNVLIDNSELNSCWLDLYKHIYQANAAIEGIENSSNISQSAKTSMIGEAKFIRAFCFFYLVNLWGDVPLTLTTDYRINEKLARTPANEVYKQIVDDLKNAQASLPEKYLTVDKVRANKYAATALLSRVYLYLKNWESAEIESTKLISIGTFLPLPAPSATFTKGSTETIFQIYPVNYSTVNTYDGAYFVPSASASVIPRYLITDQLNAAFEQGDNRKSSWIGNKTVSGQIYSYPFKYKLRDSSTPLVEYTVVLRLAEQILNRAEARAQRDNPSGAIDDINLLRVRAGLNALSRNMTIAKEDLLTMIYRERQVELFAEWGHRWLDLKRLNRASEILQPIKGTNWQNTDVLWPIPVNQILTNQNLKQNDGY